METTSPVNGVAYTGPSRDLSHVVSISFHDTFSSSLVATAKLKPTVDCVAQGDTLIGYCKLNLQLNIVVFDLSLLMTF